MLRIDACMVAINLCHLSIYEASTLRTLNTDTTEKFILKYLNICKRKRWLNLFEKDGTECSEPRHICHLSSATSEPMRGPHLDSQANERPETRWWGCEALNICHQAAREDEWTEYYLGTRIFFKINRQQERRGETLEIFNSFKLK